MKFKNFILFIFLLGFQNAFAQTNFSGKVLDAITQKPLASASISIGNKKINSNTTGDFNFTLVGSTKIVISYIGYETFIRTINANEKNTIIMETGGMKGKRKEIIREELHELLCDGFGVLSIHSEYGMTEL